MPAPVLAFAALGDPVRSTIVDRLVPADLTVGELAAGFDLSFQAVSQHLAVLERAGIVTRHREGRHRRVRLEADGLAAPAGWVEVRRLGLEARYHRLDALLERLQHDPNAPDPTGTEESR